MNINDTLPSHYAELTIEYIEDKFHLLNKPEVDLCFSAIEICTHIVNHHIHQLYQLNNHKRIIHVYDRHLDNLLKGMTPFSAIEEPLRFDCEHREILYAVFVDKVQPYLTGYDEHNFWKRKPPSTYSLLDADGTLKLDKSQAELLNDLVAGLINHLNNPKFKQKQAERLRKAKHQYDRARYLVEVLRAKYSKLLILRVDLCWKNQNLDKIRLHELKSTLSAFFKRFHHDPALPNIVGYIWKLEFGQQKGYHYHCLFFLNGNKYQNDAYYAEQIGSYWCTFTKDQGFYFNCNRNKLRYRNLAIGMVRHENQAMFDNLDKVLVYICKQDQFIIDKHLSGIQILRTFQTSAIPKNNGKALGRPRAENKTAEYIELTETI